MTNTLGPFAAHANRPLLPVTTDIDASPSANSTLPEASVSEEDEDGSIKCICGYQDDDGLTVFCEQCKTWQHIGCYYPGATAATVPEIHYCSDCVPMPVDVKAARERQKLKRDQGENSEQRLKRQTNRSHKKKPKDQNGVAEPPNSWGSDTKYDISTAINKGQPPLKRNKTSHRSSASMGSQVSFVPPDTHNQNIPNGHSDHSLIKTQLLESPKDCDMPLYSHLFMHLYDEDPGEIDLAENIFQSLNTTNTLFSSFNDPKIRTKCVLKSEFDLVPKKISKHDREDLNYTYAGRHPRWQYVTVDSFVATNEYIGEIKGEIGLLDEYCKDPTNDWAETHHPKPFVFFAGEVPVYIDTRKQGNLLRYVQRSCQPTISLKPVITDSGDYHFCFFARGDLQPGTELTVCWYMDQQMMDGAKEEGMNPAIETWVSKLFANHGGCACHNIEPCILARYDRRQATSSMKDVEPMPIANGKRKKRGKQQMSPSATNYTVHSRASSESLKPQDNDELDNRSVSGSVRSRDISRGVTPQTSATELTDRDKRKIAVAERKFEQLEHDREHQSQRKRKRHSAGSNAQATHGSSSRPLGARSASISQAAGYASRPSHADAGTSRRMSHSPPSERLSNSHYSGNSSRVSSGPYVPSTPSPLSRPRYVDVSMQTDLDACQPVAEPPVTCSTWHRPFIPLTKKFLKRCHEQRVRQLEERRKKAEEVKQRVSTTIPVESNETTTSLELSKQSGSEVEMKDASSGNISPTSKPPEFIPVQKPRPPDPNRSKETSVSPNDEHKIKPPPAPWPARNNDTPMYGVAAAPLSNFRGTDLHVSLPPKEPLSMILSPTHSTLATPSTITSSVTTPYVHPPDVPSTSSIAQPSPVKKKLSLNDYMNRRAHMTPTTEKKEHSGGLMNMPNKPGLPRVEEKKDKEQEIKSETISPIVLPTKDSSAARQEDSIMVMNELSDIKNNQTNKPNMGGTGLMNVSRN
ncbi:MAG: hypothetical protein M1834_003999 [Cirrosporium novae-zelandiae]|nr:MAG: hypothetical protein M1834_003999 [Cirrosporium novae-zelandiae]